MTYTVVTFVKFGCKQHNEVNVWLTYGKITDVAYRTHGHSLLLNARRNCSNVRLEEAELNRVSLMWSIEIDNTRSALSQIQLRNIVKNRPTFAEVLNDIEYEWYHYQYKCKKHSLSHQLTAQIHIENSKNKKMVITLLQHIA